jgi:hypothetical protein
VVTQCPPQTEKGSSRRDNSRRVLLHGGVKHWRINLAKKSAAKRSTQKRELIDTGSDKRFLKRRADGTFKESDDVSRSLRADRARKAKTASKAGHGDQGDRRKKR